MIKKIFQFITVVIFISGLLSLQACSTGSTSGASPVASIPLPEEGTITVSNPDSSGFSLVTGSADTVPDSAIVIVQISATSAFNFNVPSTLKNLVNPAYAAESSCSSDLPTCPDLSADDECQFTANEDGSFAFQVPADAGTEITIGYIDAENSCAETFYEDTFVIDESLTAFDFDIVSAALYTNTDAATSTSTSELILLGETITGSNQILVYDLTDFSSTAFDISEDITDPVQNIELMDFSQTDSRMVGVATDSGYYLSTYNFSDISDFSTWIPITPSDDSIAASALYHAGSDSYTPSETDLIASGACYGESSSRTRDFFYATDPDNSHLFILRAGFSPSVTSQEVTEILLDTEEATAQRFLHGYIKDGTFYAIGEFLNGTLTNPELTELAIVTFSINNAFCGDTISFESYDALLEGEAPENFYVEELSSADETETYFLYLNIDTQVFYVIKLSDPSQTVSLDIATSFFDEDFNTAAIVSGEPDASDDNLINLRVITSDGRGLGRFILNAETMVFNLPDTEDSILDILTVDPVEFLILDDTDYIVDRGISGDGVSTLLVNQQ